MTLLFTLTPIHPHTSKRIDSTNIFGTLYVYNWFKGYHALPRKTELYPRDWARDARSALDFHADIDEDLETLYDRNRLLLVAGKNYEDDTDLGPYWEQNIVCIRITTRDPSVFQDRQLLVTYDVEAPRKNKIQLFVEAECWETVQVSGRSMQAVLADMPDIDEIKFFLRPVSNELYIYSARVDLY